MKPKKIVIGVCGSVAAVEVPRFVRKLRREGVEVECVMSDAARGIIHPNVLEWASGNEVVTKITGKVEHVRLCGVDGEARLLLICPATSNTLSKIAYGVDDTPVTTFASTALGSGMKIILTPAMHYSMYMNPFVVEAMERLTKEGILVMKSRIEENKAKLPEVDEILRNVLKELETK
ncbi:MAG: flavoprotein [Candidatus Altiarchaeota archaeon]|nr:flavoprotein [Candidatus Altiarchaeota archaeon]